MENMREKLVFPNDQIPLRRRISSYELLVQRLSEMGFDEYAIEQAISITGASTVEEALDYLLRINDRWSGSFGPTEEDYYGFQGISSDDYRSRPLSTDHFSLVDNPCKICYEEITNEWSHPECCLLYTSPSPRDS